MTRLSRYLTNMTPLPKRPDSPSRGAEKDCGSGQKFFHFFLSSRRVRLNGPAPSLKPAGVSLGQKAPNLRPPCFTDSFTFRPLVCQMAKYLTLAEES